jgi:hypothetical protein
LWWPGFEPVPDAENDSATILALVLGPYMSADQLIASAEARLKRALREIERHRADLRPIYRRPLPGRCAEAARRRPAACVAGCGLSDAGRS